MTAREKRKKDWVSQVYERTDKNQSILEEVAQVLKDLYEARDNLPKSTLHKDTIHNHLKLYQKLNKDGVIAELAKLKVTDLTLF